MILTVEAEQDQVVNPFRDAYVDRAVGILVFVRHNALMDFIFRGDRFT